MDNHNAFNGNGIESNGTSPEPKNLTEEQALFLREQMLNAISACQKASAENKSTADILVFSAPGLDLEKDHKQTELAQELLARCGYNGISANLEFNHSDMFNKAVQFFKLTLSWDKSKSIWGIA